MPLQRGDSIAQVQQDVDRGDSDSDSEQQPKSCRVHLLIFNCEIAEIGANCEFKSFYRNQEIYLLLDLGLCGVMTCMSVMF